MYHTAFRLAVRNIESHKPFQNKTATTNTAQCIHNLFQTGLNSCVAFKLNALEPTTHFAAKTLTSAAFFFNTIFVSSHMYPENPEGTQVIVGSMNMGYISDIARNRTHNLLLPKRESIPLGHCIYSHCIYSLGKARLYSSYHHHFSDLTSQDNAFKQQCFCFNCSTVWTIGDLQHRK